jgi:hypothetical protein
MKIIVVFYLLVAASLLAISEESPKEENNFFDVTEMIRAQEELREFPEMDIIIQAAIWRVAIFGARQYMVGYDNEHLIDPYALHVGIFPYPYPAEENPIWKKSIKLVGDILEPLYPIVEQNQNKFIREEKYNFCPQLRAVWVCLLQSYPLIVSKIMKLVREDPAFSLAENRKALSEQVIENLLEIKPKNYERAIPEISNYLRVQLGRALYSSGLNKNSAIMQKALGLHINPDDLSVSKTNELADKLFEILAGMPRELIVLISHYVLISYHQCIETALLEFCDGKKIDLINRPVQK